MHTWMGAFGAPTAKPTRLFSDSIIVRRLHRKLSLKEFQPTHKLTAINEPKKSAGMPCVNGMRDQLHQTQEYPWDYGTAVKDCLVDLRESDIYINSDSDNSADTEADPTDEWDDAWNQQLANHIGMPTDRLVA